MRKMRRHLRSSKASVLVHNAAASAVLSQVVTWYSRKTSTVHTKLKLLDVLPPDSEREEEGEDFGILRFWVFEILRAALAGSRTCLLSCTECPPGCREVMRSFTTSPPHASPPDTCPAAPWCTSTSTMAHHGASTRCTMVQVPSNWYRSDFRCVRLCIDRPNGRNIWKGFHRPSSKELFSLFCTHLGWGKGKCCKKQFF